MGRNSEKRALAEAAKKAEAAKPAEDPKIEEQASDPTTDPTAQTIPTANAGGGLDTLVEQLEDPKPSSVPAPTAPAKPKIVGDPKSTKFPAELGTEEARKTYEDGTIVVVSDLGKFSKAPGQGWARAT